MNMHTFSYIIILIHNSKKDPKEIISLSGPVILSMITQDMRHWLYQPLSDPLFPAVQGGI